jgi:hypothetical protein
MTAPSCSTQNPGANVTVPAAGEQQPEVRVGKVLDIRRQLGEGTYSIADRLDVVVERIIRDLG